MGDADNSQIRMSVEEIEEWLDEALNEMDDGLSSLFCFMNILNDRIANVTLEVATCQKFKICFTAFSLFVIPIVTSIGIAYGSTGLVESNSIIEAGLQIAIMFLMSLSACVGFPFYIYTLWNAYYADSMMETRKKTRSDVGFWDSLYGRMANWRQQDGDDNNLLAMPFTEGSVENFSEVSRVISRRIRDSVRSGLQRRVSQTREVEQVTAQVTTAARNEDIPESYNSGETSATTVKLVDLDSDSLSPDLNAALSQFMRNQMFTKSEAESRGFQVIILNANKDLSVEVERPSEKDGLSERTESDARQQTGFRNIPVERVAEGDNGPVFGCRDGLSAQNYHQEVFCQ